jgi:AcrR family transcriptional regulator
MTAVEKELKETREALLEAAKHVFAARGFDGATLKDIADQASANVAMISYYFDGKEGLYRSCLEAIGTDRLLATQRILTPPSSREDIRARLGLFLEEFFYSHLQEPEVVRMIHQEFSSDMALTKDIFQNTFVKIFETLLGFFLQAQQRGLIRSELDVEIMTTHFWSGLIHLSRMDPLQKDLCGYCVSDAPFRERLLKYILTDFLDGLFKPAGTSS